MTPLAWPFCVVAALYGVGHAAAQTLPENGQTRALADSQVGQGFYLHTGPGALVFSASAIVRETGAVLPGGTVSIAPNLTEITELGYRWRHVAVSLTGGLPPRATVDGAGSLAPLGTLGHIRYGPVVLTAHYHIGGWGRFQPYIGGGPVLLLIFKDTDGAVSRLDVRDHLGICAQLGTEFTLSRHWSLFVDAKKAALKTDATAWLGVAAIAADIKLNPLVASGGLSFRF